MRCLHQQIRLIIPDELSFSDLHLVREPDSSVSFDWDVIAGILHASGLSVELSADDLEDQMSALIVSWYRAHRRQGGAPDPVAEDLIAEVSAEEQIGQTVSHPPGRA
ncbi:MAG: hypothetical protein EOM91_15925 [Sphingobacteriia bacterium]|nr:hypothetical protein [Sphingobacteriia bacterium]NCC40867.1 hypothetical protein [Gammaproteobacteria bacterium]